MVAGLLAQELRFYLEISVFCTEKMFKSSVQNESVDRQGSTVQRSLMSSGNKRLKKTVLVLKPLVCGETLNS